ncbi:MAG: nuclear transport factor 2 family protein [Nitrospira sp.]|nr:nuclear transport factor 2 family protein [Nitrospira sp.]
MALLLWRPPDQPRAPRRRSLQDRAALRRFFTDMVERFQTIDVTEDLVVASANRTAVKFTARGVDKNGRLVVFEGIDAFELNDQGKIQPMWGYWNPEVMTVQLEPPRNQESPDEYLS